MNLWSHRFSQNTKSFWNLLTFSKEKVQNKYSNISFSSRLLAPLCHSFAHLFSGIFGKKNEGEKIPPICCMHWFWLKKFFFFTALAHKSEARKVCKVNQEIYKINDLVAKGAKGSIWAKTTFKRPPCLFYALTLIEKIFVKTYKKRVLAKTICNINAQ